MQQHAGQVTNMVSMEVGEEHGLQTGEVQSASVKADVHTAASCCSVIFGSRRSTLKRLDGAGWAAAAAEDAASWPGSLICSGSPGCRLPGSMSEGRAAGDRG